MNEPTMHNLVRRLERLEREYRRLKRVGSLMLVGIAGLLMMGQSQCNLSKRAASKAKNVVEAQEIIIRDAEGKARAELSQSALWFKDSNGNTRVALGVLSGLQLLGTDGSMISLFTPTELGLHGPYLSIIGKDSTSVAKLEPAGLSLLSDGK